MNIAANQAAIGLQESSLLRAQSRVASELDQRVAERTREHATINEELRKEIGERKKKEEKLRLNEEALRLAHTQIARSEERWRSVFENSAIGVALTGLNGQFIAANPVYQKMVGYTEEELRQLSFIDITVEEDRIPTRCSSRNFWKERRNFSREAVPAKKFSTVWVRNSVSVVPGTERVPRFLMALSEDVSKRRLAEEALNETRSEPAHMTRVTH